MDFMIPPTLNAEVFSKGKSYNFVLRLCSVIILPVLALVMSQDDYYHNILWPEIVSEVTCSY